MKKSLESFDHLVVVVFDGKQYSQEFRSPSKSLQKNIKITRIAAVYQPCMLHMLNQNVRWGVPALGVVAVAVVVAVVGVGEG